MLNPNMIDVYVLSLLIGFLIGVAADFIIFSTAYGHRFFGAKLWVSDKIAKKHQIHTWYLAWVEKAAKNPEESETIYNRLFDGITEAEPMFRLLSCQWCLGTFLSTIVATIATILGCIFIGPESLLLLITIPAISYFIISKIAIQ